VMFYTPGYRPDLYGVLHLHSVRHGRQGVDLRRAAQLVYRRRQARRSRAEWPNGWQRIIM
jgi:hypothetical protein